MKEPLLFMFYDQHMPHFLSLIIVNVDVFKKNTQTAIFPFQNITPTQPFEMSAFVLSQAILILFNSDYILILAMLNYL